MPSKPHIGHTLEVSSISEEQLGHIIFFVYDVALIGTLEYEVEA